MTAPSRRQKTVIKIDEIQRIKHKYLSSLNKICNANINIRFKNSSELPNFSPLRAECDGEGGGGEKESPETNEIEGHPPFVAP